MSIHAGDPEVYRITTVGTSASAEQRSRTRRYLASMAIRTLCFLGAVVAPSPWRWVLVVGAVILPYIAVVMANATRRGSRPSELEIVVRPDTAAITDRAG